MPQTLNLLSQGAEAKIFFDAEKNLIIKDRVSKSYRHPELDNKIRKKRTKSEAKLLAKASHIINAPSPLHTPEVYQILIPFIEGKKLSEHLDKFPPEKQKEICKTIGESVAKLHSHDIIHGDLTTSNMIFVGDLSDKPPIVEPQLKNISAVTISKRRNREGWGKQLHNFKIFFIDFGLGFISKKIEDKAVDLHLLKHALGAKHFKHYEILLKEVLESYERNCPEAKKIFERMKAIEKRGRYRF